MRDCAVDTMSSRIHTSSRFWIVRHSVSESHRHPAKRSCLNLDPRRCVNESKAGGTLDYEGFSAIRYACINTRSFLASSLFILSSSRYVKGINELQGVHKSFCVPSTRSLDLVEVKCPFWGIRRVLHCRDSSWARTWSPPAKQAN